VQDKGTAKISKLHDWLLFFLRFSQDIGHRSELTVTLGPQAAQAKHHLLELRDFIISSQAHQHDAPSCEYIS
jgi:hypothetical protein